MSSDIQLWQDNAITRSSFSLTALQMDLFFNVLKQIKVESNSSHMYQINISDVVDLEREKTTNYTALRHATKDLLSKIFEIPLNNGDVIQSALISATRYVKGEGRILVQVSDMMKPYLIDIAKNTTRYHFEIAIALKSVYAKRFYQFMAQWKVAGEWKVSLDEVKKRLQLADRYENYFDFKKGVIEVARMELMQHADLYFTYVEIKQSRRVTDFHFKIHSKTIKSESETVGPVPAAAEIFPMENRLVAILKDEFKLSTWQVMNVLKTFDKEKLPIWQSIDEIRKQKTIVSVGAKAWAHYKKKYQVPETKI